MSNRFSVVAMMALAAIASSLDHRPAYAQALEPYLGEIMWVPYDFAPRNWASCNGQVLAINQNTALFSLLGTTYGGNGQTTFALPDMRGRVMVGSGDSIDNVSYVLGESGGQESERLITNEMPGHAHAIAATDAAGNAASPAGAHLSAQTLPMAQTPTAKAYSTAPVNAFLTSDSIGVTGNDQLHNNMQPYVALHCIIAVHGLYPAFP
jgi:microcystin-dependent protein